MKPIANSIQNISARVPTKFRELLPFLLLALTLKCVDLVANTLTTTLFLTQVGTEYLPIAYVILGVLSIPIYLGLAHLSARYCTAKLLMLTLGGSALLTLGFCSFLTSQPLSVTYSAFIFCSSLWEGLAIYVLLPTLVLDYFTELEYKRFAWLIAIALALGSIAGGALTSLLAIRFTTTSLLLLLPILYIAVALQVYQLTQQRSVIPHTTEPKTVADERDSKNLLTWLDHKKQALRRYPLISLVIISTLIQVVLETVAKYQYLDIYTQVFAGNEQSLTQFVSQLAIALSLLEIAVLYGFTRPFIRHLGVPRMQMVYPVTTLLSFAWLALSPSLPAAIALNTNARSLDTTIDEPLNGLTYNALPHSLAAEVRSLNEGLVYSLGTALAGGLLWQFHSLLSLQQLLALELSLCGLLLVIHRKIGKQYLRSLRQQLHRRFEINQRQLLEKQLNSLQPTVSNFSRPNSDGSLVPLMRIMLRKSSAEQQCQFLKKALKLAQPGDRQLANMALVVLHHPSEQVVILALRLLGKTRIDTCMLYVAAQFSHEYPAVRAAAATALASYGDKSLKLTKDYLMSPHTNVAETAVSAIAQVRTRQAADILYRHLKPEYVAIAQEVTTPCLSTSSADSGASEHLDIGLFIQKILGILSHLEGAEELRPILQSLQDSDVRVRARAVELLANLPHRRFVMPVLAHLEAQVRASPLTISSSGSHSSSQELPTPVHSSVTTDLRRSPRWQKAYG